MTETAKTKSYKTGPWISLGIIGIIALFGGFGTWAATAQISGAIIAPGTIGVESRVKTVQHLEGGYVGKILVHDGDRVKQGDVLVRLDDTAAKASYDIINDGLLELQAKQARLYAERDGVDVISFPKTLLSRKSDPGIKTKISGQTSLFDARRKGREGKVRILKQRLVQLRELIKGLDKQLNGQKEQLKIINKSLKKKLVAMRRGSVSSDMVDKLRLQKAELVGGTGKLYAQTAKAHGSMAEIEEEILQVDTEFREQVLSEIRKTQPRISETQEKKTALEEKLRRIDIRSPQTGRIHNMTVFTEGGVISPAKPILQIIPEKDHLIVETRIQPSDRHQVRINQAAIINLSAFDSRTTPSLNGLVKTISPGTVTDPNTGAPFYTVEIVIPPREMARLADDQELLPGMPAETFIRTGDRTPLDYLLKPLWKIMQRAGKER